MAITNTWSINDMQRTDSDGNVFLVYWSMIAQSDGTPSYSATEGGKLRMDADPSDPDFIPYADLTENDVLGWVYDSLIVGDETADEAKLTVPQKFKNKLTLRRLPNLGCLGYLNFNLN